MTTFTRTIAVLFLVALVLVLGSFASGKNTSLTGVVSDSMCGAKHMLNDDAKCTRGCAKNGSQYALVVKNTVYKLKGRSEQLEKLSGQSVTIVGNLDGDTIQLVTVTPVEASQTAGSPASPISYPPTKIATIEGLVRDVACPIQNKEATSRNFNLKCAEDCAKLGSPLIILSDDGTLYTPISESMPDRDQRQRLMPFLGKYVRVKGQVFERAGTHAIAIKDITELKNVHLVTNSE